MAKTVATSKGSFSGILDALARAEQTQKQIADYTKELAVASGQYGILPASQPIDTTLSQLGGLTTVKPGQAWRYVRPAPEGQAGTGGGGIPSGPILIYGTQTPVHESFFPMIQSGLEQNQFANSKLDNSTVMPPLSMTNEWLALILAIIDQESKFGQLPIKDIYAPAGAYPAPGKWLPNRGGYVGPMQMATRGNGNIVYGNVYDAQTNIHGGIHHLWWFGNCNFANARSNRGTDGQMFGWINKLAWTIQSYNAGPGNTNQNYYAKVWERNYPWYLQQLQRVGTRSGSGVPVSAQQATGTAAAIIQEGLKWQGTPYVLGGDSRSGIDCSAFVRRACRAAGIELPRVSSDQAKVGTPVLATDILPGDLVFFQTPARTRSLQGRINHVAIYYGDGKILHAHGGKGGTTDITPYSNWYKQYTKTIRRVAGGGGDFSSMATTQTEIQGAIPPDGAISFTPSLQR